jgi:hypothetical protein
LPVDGLLRRPTPGEIVEGPWIQLPALVGEGALYLWLLVVGLDVDRWNQQASAALRLQSAQLEALP